MKAKAPHVCTCKHRCAPFFVPFLASNLFFPVWSLDIALVAVIDVYADLDVAAALAVKANEVVSCPYAPFLLHPAAKIGSPLLALSPATPNKAKPFFSH